MRHNNYVKFSLTPTNSRQTRTEQKKTEKKLANRKTIWVQICASGEPFTFVAEREQFIVHTNDPVGESIFLYGEYDFQKLELALRLLGRKHVETLVDVGANVGSICIPAVARGFAGRSVAIEPEPTNFLMLTANIELNTLQHKIRAHQNAVGPVDNQSIRLELSSENFGDHRITPTVGTPRERDSTTVTSMTLDTLVPNLNPLTDLIFMDVQGFEKFVLDGATNAIQSRVPIVMEYFPEGIQEHCSLEDLLTVIAPYSGYYDLNLPAPVFTPLEGLRDFWHGLLRGPFPFGDILLL
jgi:FkbM family methyltransferase